MPRNKPRINLALYVRPKHPKSYHYAIIIIPKRSMSKSSPAIKFHVKNTLVADPITGVLSSPWRLEHTIIPVLKEEQRLLVLVTVGKLLISIDELERFIKDEVAIYQLEDKNQDSAKAFNCVSWVQDAVNKLMRNGMSSGVDDGEWEKTKQKAEDFVQKMNDQGRWQLGWKGATGVPILDLLEDKEKVLDG